MNPTKHTKLFLKRIKISDKKKITPLTILTKNNKLKNRC